MKTTDPTNLPLLPAPSNGSAPPVFDPFDPAYVRVTTEPIAHSIRTSIPVKKPKRGLWFRASLEPEHQVQVALYKHEDNDNIEGTFYLVAPPVRPLLADVITNYLLALCRGHRSGPFFFPVALPRDGREASRWTTSSITLIHAAQAGWIRRVENDEDGYCYDVPDEPDAFPATVAFPTEPMNELLKLAFKAFHIDTEDHPLVGKIRGRKAKRTR